ncbi:PAB-dependent Poly(A) specific ribonuclease subunit [Aphelenchoides avenae]|nr:PAB-dependent Poly(A) specific ribonuclease subunit [Aphelenchus avenae]
MYGYPAANNMDQFPPSTSTSSRLMQFMPGNGRMPPPHPPVMHQPGVPGLSTPPMGAQRRPMGITAPMAKMAISSNAAPHPPPVPGYIGPSHDRFRGIPQCNVPKNGERAENSHLAHVPAFNGVDGTGVYHDQSPEALADHRHGVPAAASPTDNYYMYRGRSIGGAKGKGAADAFFVNADLKAELTKRQLDTQTLTPAPDLPPAVEDYRNLQRIDHASPGSMEIVYKSVSVTDGLPRCLRRIPNSRSLTTKQIIACERWNAKNFMHPHVVPLRDVFQTRAFGDNSLIFVYDYFPISRSLKSHHFGSSSGSDQVWTDSQQSKFQKYTATKTGN